MLGDRHVVHVGKAGTWDVHRLVLPIGSDVKQHEIGVVEMLREPGGSDEYLVALGAGGEGEP